MAFEVLIQTTGKNRRGDRQLIFERILATHAPLSVLRMAWCIATWRTSFVLLGFIFSVTDFNLPRNYGAFHSNLYMQKTHTWASSWSAAGICFRPSSLVWGKTLGVSTADIYRIYFRKSRLDQRIIYIACKVFDFHGTSPDDTIPEEDVTRNSFPTPGCELGFSKGHPWYPLHFQQPCLRWQCGGFFSGFDTIHCAWQWRIEWQKRGELQPCRPDL